jgi:hypothetical protein
MLNVIYFAFDIQEERPNVTVEGLAALALCIGKVPGSNIGQVTNYPDSVIL